jgi:pimeloyl-ACP methyl ester carboxylesterase
MVFANSDLSTENLQYLTTDQVLADVAYFTESFNYDTQYKYDRWLLVGGSYSGTLVTWARHKYPHLFHAAFATSSPVLAKLDFHGKWCNCS